MTRWTAPQRRRLGHEPRTSPYNIGGADRLGGGGGGEQPVTLQPAAANLGPRKGFRLLKSGSLPSGLQAGLMLTLRQKTLPGSYCALMLASRANFSVP